MKDELGEYTVPILTVIALLSVATGFLLGKEVAREGRVGSISVVDTRDQLARDRVSSLEQRAGWYERQVNDQERRIDELTAQLGDLQRAKAWPKMNVISVPCSLTTTFLFTGGR